MRKKNTYQEVGSYEPYKIITGRKLASQPTIKADQEWLPLVQQDIE
jgi:hypothetical protein